MTRARLIELKDALEREAWEVEGEFGADDWLHVERDRIQWRLARPSTGAGETLEFVLFAALGGPTERLADLSHVDARSAGQRLYFEKIRSARWREALPAFVRALD
jgi:hypothetical protein